MLAKISTTRRRSGYEFPFSRRASGLKSSVSGLGWIDDPKRNDWRDRIGAGYRHVKALAHEARALPNHICRIALSSDWRERRGSRDDKRVNEAQQRVGSAFSHEAHRASTHSITE